MIGFQPLVNILKIHEKKLGKFKYIAYLY